ncbi:MAG: 30S processome protein Utp24 [Desulfurococcaceae archaeon]
MSGSSTSKRVIVLLDTNMLMLMASGIAVLENIKEELETEPSFIVLSPVYNELLKIYEKSVGKTKKQALFAMEISRKYCEIVDYPLKEGETTDDAIIRFALENNAIVATNDKALRSRLREIGIPEAYLREESHRIKVEGYYK